MHDKMMAAATAAADVQVPRAMFAAAVAPTFTVNEKWRVLRSKKLASTMLNFAVLTAAGPTTGTGHEVVV